eukprot:6208498-Pleurochrysis_carterae.AAC.1
MGVQHLSAFLRRVIEKPGSESGLAVTRAVYAAVAVACALLLVNIVELVRDGGVDNVIEVVEERGQRAERVAQLRLAHAQRPVQRLEHALGRELGHHRQQLGAHRGDGVGNRRGKVGRVDEVVR